MKKARLRTWWVYLVRCADGTLYCGASNDMNKRLQAHNTGAGAKYTRGRTPVKLVFKKRCGTKSQALITEARIKHLKRCDKVRMISAFAGHRPATGA